MPIQRSLRRPAVRAALVYGGPTLAIVLLAVLPVVLGDETLILRDVLETHLMLEAPLAEALRAGEMPVLDVHRGGGQPLLGNPNAVPFYPGNVLYAVAPTLWALNAHFWLHWLLAPAAMFLLGRAWGLGRPAAWAAGVCYATSGFFLSQLNLYNLVAGAALVPALVAAVLLATEEGERGQRWSWAAGAGGLWALVLLSGDPTTAVAGALLAASAAAVRSPRALLRPRVLGPLALAIGLGTLVALPQIVEMLRILPATSRGYRGFSDSRLTIAAWHPIHALEWLVPTAFGRLDLMGPGGFWARGLFAGHPPLLLSLYPGVLAPALVLAAGLPRDRRSGWAWGTAAVGALLAAGGTHPVGRFLFELPGAHLFRYPVKLWLLVAVALAVLCGVGFERAFASGGLRRLGRGLGLVALLVTLCLGWIVTFPEHLEVFTFAFAPESWSLQLAGAEWMRWVVTLATVLVLTALLGGAASLGRRRPVVAGALLLALHAAGQVYLLRGLRVTDDARYYTRPAPLAARIPAGARVVHAGDGGLFGQSQAIAPPDARAFWGARQEASALIPGVGVLQRGLRYELNRSPEGLSSFLARVAHEAVKATPDDRARLRALGRWGVEYVISREPLAGVPLALAEAAVAPGAIEPVYLYRLRRPAPEVLLADLAIRAPHLNAAWSLFAGPGFDPERHVVLPPADGAPDGGAASDALPPLPSAAGREPGRVRVLRSGDELLETEVATPAPAVLVLQRAVLPVWRATVDGEPVEIEPANLYRIGVPVPPGRHRVRLWVERGPLRLALAGSAAGGLGLLALALLGRRRGGREAVEVEGAAEDVERTVPEQPVGRRPLGPGGVEPADEVLGGDDVDPRPG